MGAIDSPIRKRLDRDAYAVALSILFRYVLLGVLLATVTRLPNVDAEALRNLALVGLSFNTIFLAALVFLYFRGQRPSAAVSSRFLWAVFLHDQTALAISLVLSGGLYSPFFPLLLLGVVGMIILKAERRFSAWRLAAWCYPLVAFTVASLVWLFGSDQGSGDLLGVSLVLALKLIMLGGAILVAVLLNHYSQELMGRSLRAVQEESQRRVELEQELAQKQKLATTGTLVSGVAHELNNPLAVILGTSQLMLNRERFGDDVRRLARIKNAAQRCQEIVDSLRVMAYQRKVTRHDLRLQRLLRHALDGLRERIEEQRVAVHMDVAPELRVYGNAVELERVFANLLTNALQAMVEDRPGELRITADLLEDRVQLRVADNGRGMTTDTMQRVFEPFFTTKGVGGGLGLGLAMVYRIVERMGGKVHVESAPDVGTAITVGLPPARGASTCEDPLEIPSGDLLRGRTVLVLESHEGRLGPLVRACRQWGAEVQIAHSEDGTRLLQEGAWDLVLSDVGPPESRLWARLFALVERTRRGELEVLVAVDEDEDPEVLQFLESNTVPRVPLPTALESQQLALARLTATAAQMSTEP